MKRFGFQCIVALAGVTAAMVTGLARAQAPTEIVYATFLDPNNARDPRAAAKTSTAKTL